MTNPLTSFRVLSFDCYGTLIDWETGIWDQLARLATDAGLSRSEFLPRYASVESLLEAENPHLPYRELLALVYYRLAEDLGVDPTDRDAIAYAQSVASWPAFADTTHALRILGYRYKLVILSNVDSVSFAGSQRQLRVDFDVVCTAEEIGSYKPDPANFEYLISRVGTELDVGPDQILHVAQSLYHDHVPAISAGLTTAWIDRQRLSEGGEWGATARVESPPTPAYRFFSLGELAEAVASAD